MSFRKQLSIASVALLFAMSYAIAQRDGGGRSGSDRGGSDRGSASSGQTTTHSSSTSVVHSTPSSSGGGGGSTGYYGGNSGYYYIPNYNAYYANNFLWSLYNRYPYFSMSNYAFRYDVGDSPIDRNLLRLALQDSYESANAMVNQVDNLSRLIDQFETNQLDRKQFQARFDTSLTEIRKLAKSIKKDERLEFLDQRKGVSSEEPPKAASIAEMRALVAQLSEQAAAMRDGLENYYVRDYTRTVEVDHLKQPSFKSLSERIDKLAKAIEKSADRM
ncbi:MAG: hypothetical protein EHM23_01270 [Acidobacteria bacterium]|nr:MAG: hypothetical protein EHM23_17290 [Acidobacteriota bacterium]RPJ63907.1 MAG: hypothetical protein EHM23_01270 [Acidobacteriota bacterium]